jgi:hypothetical protein
MQSWMKTVILMTAGIFVLSAGQSSAGVSGSVRVPVALKNSEISFIGDDSFITKRYTYEPQPRDRIWRELLILDGGRISYVELSPAYSYGAGAINDVPSILIRRWSKSYPVTRDDFKKSSNTYGTYDYVVKGDSNETCAATGQFFGVGELMGDGNGNKTIFLNLCWSASRGSADDLEKFVLKLMQQWRADEGKINKAKAASK